MFPRPRRASPQIHHPSRQRLAISALTSDPRKQSNLIPQGLFLASESMGHRGAAVSRAGTCLPQEGGLAEPRKTFAITR